MTVILLGPRSPDMTDRVIVSEAARRTGYRPRDISNLFYERLLSDEDAPVVGGRRLIPESLIPRIIQLLEARSARRPGQRAPASKAVPAEMPR
jgi:hypothetical protein